MVSIDVSNALMSSVMAKSASFFEAISSSSNFLCGTEFPIGFSGGKLWDTKGSFHSTCALLFSAITTGRHMIPWFAAKTMSIEANLVGFGCSQCWPFQFPDKKILPVWHWNTFNLDCQVAAMSVTDPSSSAIGVGSTLQFLPSKPQTWARPWVSRTSTFSSPQTI